MTLTKNVYALMLALVIVFSGCLSGNTDGQEEIVPEEDENSPPLIYGHVTYESYWDEDSGELLEPGLVSTSIVWDYDGEVVAFGIDWTMDGIIDQNFTGNYSELEYRYMPTNGDWFNPQSYDEVQEGRNGCYQFVNVIAIDDDGASTINPQTISFKEGENTGSCTTESREG